MKKIRTHTCITEIVNLYMTSVQDKVLARDPSTRLLDGQFQFWTGEKFLRRLCRWAFVQAFFSIDDSKY